MSDPTETPPVVVHDKRRVDANSDVPLAAPEEPETVTAESYLEDLQRLKAEFDNYRKRVERDRLEWALQAQAKLVSELLLVVDDIARARAHADLDPGFRLVAEDLEKVLTQAGLEPFGATGETFDPMRHEALTHVVAPDVDGEVVFEVFRSGFTFAGRVLRPAQVVVAGPPPKVPDEAD